MHCKAEVRAPVLNDTFPCVPHVQQSSLQESLLSKTGKQVSRNGRDVIKGEVTAHVLLKNRSRTEDELASNAEVEVWVCSLYP